MPCDDCFEVSYVSDLCLRDLSHCTYRMPIDEEIEHVTHKKYTVKHLTCLKCNLCIKDSVMITHPCIISRSSWHYQYDLNECSLAVQGHRPLLTSDFSQVTYCKSCFLQSVDLVPDTDCSPNEYWDKLVNKIHSCPLKIDLPISWREKVSGGMVKSARNKVDG